jgi:hypothetical protein
MRKDVAVLGDGAMAYEARGLAVLPLGRRFRARGRWRLTSAIRREAVATSAQPAPAGPATNAACAAILAVEAVGSCLMWAPIPIAWMWIGARFYDLTGSVAADGGVVLLGFLGTTIVAMRGLTRLDRVWVALRRRAGHDQIEGALTRVVVASATFGILAFVLWYYVFSKAFILPFMPSQ